MMWSMLWTYEHIGPADRAGFRVVVLSEGFQPSIGVEFFEIFTGHG